MLTKFNRKKVERIQIRIINLETALMVEKEIERQYNLYQMLSLNRAILEYLKICYETQQY